MEEKGREKEVIIIRREDKNINPATEIERLQHCLKKMYEEKGEVDKEMLALSRQIDRLVVQEITWRTKKS